MRAFALAVMMIGCGLETGGPPGGISDAGPDIPIDIGTTDSGLPCECVSAAPQGWKYVALRVDGTDSCPLGYDKRTVLVEGTAPPAQCPCACNKTLDGSCSVTQVTLTTYSDANCGTQVGTVTSGTMSAGCFAASVTGPVGNTYLKGSASALASAGTCTPVVNGQLPPVTDPHTNVGCELAASLGAGCGAGNACVPKPAAPFKMCIESSAGPCPPGWAEEHRAGEGRMDTRSCSVTGCTCAPATTCAVKGTLYALASCMTTTGVTIDMDGACKDSMKMSLAASSVETQVTPSTTCAPSGMGTPTGTSTLDRPRVICCK